VHTTDTPPAQITARQRLLCAAIIGTAFLAVWSASASAAVNALTSCDQVAREMQSLEVVADPLVAVLVDLSDLEQSPEDSVRSPETVAPLLFLAPRVASILDDVFGDSEFADADQTADDAASAQGRDQHSLNEKEREATSPVAGNVSSSDVSQPPSSLYEQAAILPRFQRQMYRTDI
jgi:hypothetical protein